MADLGLSKSSVFWVRVPASVLCVDTTKYSLIEHITFALDVEYPPSFIVMEETTSETVRRVEYRLSIWGMISRYLERMTISSGKKLNYYTNVIG